MSFVLVGWVFGLVTCPKAFNTKVGHTNYMESCSLRVKKQPNKALELEHTVGARNQFRR